MRSPDVLEARGDDRRIGEILVDFNFHKAVGCNRCGGSGYRGRVGVYELMVVEDEIKEMILRPGRSVVPPKRTVWCGSAMTAC